jgi:hypothetical protein
MYLLRLWLRNSVPVQSFDQTVRSALVLAVHVTLAGCSASELMQQDWTPPAIEDVSQAGFRRVVAENIKTMFADPASLTNVEISGVRMVDHSLNGPAWLTCLKMDANGRSQYFAIFIRGDKIVDSRAGILIDRCHKQIYSPFDIAREASPFNLAPEAKRSKPRAASAPVR